ncbi:MAG: type II toxin-antitoxin system HigB family toxin [Ginsengibacter sp.]
MFKFNENNYRLIVEINYPKGWLFIKFIGTHVQYGKINAESIEFFKRRKDH